MAKVTLKGNPVTTCGELPVLGSQAPDFILVDKNLNDKSLKDYKGKKKVLSIVPSLDTETCSLSTKTFNKKIQSKNGIVVLTISADLPFAQKRFCSAEGIDKVITLSMMRSKDFAQDYGVLIVDGPLRGLAARAIVILDENDQIIYTELVPEISMEPNYDKALAKV